MVAVNSLLYFLLSAGLSSNPEQSQDLGTHDSLNGIGEEASCLPKEHLSECEAHCQKNCTNYNKPIICPRICIKGCVCDEGLVRGLNGLCITPKQCPAKDKCPRGEHYDQCNALCQSNCDTWTKPVPCPRKCVHGCVCDKGTIRGPNGRCIKPAKCPKKASSEESAESHEDALPSCWTNEHFSICGAHCQKNCTNYNTEIVCPYICVKGCICDRGFVRGLNGKCITPEQCPSSRDVCPSGEHYDQCYARCQQNCSTWNNPIPCPRKCFHGCICDKGTVRGPNGRCISPESCPKKTSSEKIAESQEDALPNPMSIICKKNEIFKACPCHEDCDTKKTCFPCIPGCDCKSGYVRGADGTCIKKEECPREKKPDDCTELEFYDSCG